MCLSLLEEMERKRKSKSISIDTLVWEAVEAQAEKQGIAVSRWLENHLFDDLQKFGIIPKDVRRLGERRGGDRTKSKQEEELDNPNLGDAQD